MIYIIVLILFISISTAITMIYSFIKISEQYEIKEKRINNLNQQTCSKIISENLSQSIYELYIESFSHYITYILGHFSSILLDIYSVIFSIISLSMISSNTLRATKTFTFLYLILGNEATKIISLLSTFFVIILVFSRLTERSNKHFLAWTNRETIIIQINQSINYKSSNPNFEEDIFSIILNEKNKIMQTSNHK